MAKDVDTRKLKDEVTELLKKQRWERAAEVLERLGRAEPKDMAHRLKLGDTYRRMEQVPKAIASYEAAARAFADEGQLIKAIGAIKVILEIDPRNEAAQKQLAEMNNRRFAKPTLESAGLKAPRGAGVGGRTSGAIELEGPAHGAGVVSGDLGADLEPPPGFDDEPLELDDGKPTPPRHGTAPNRGPALPHRGFQGVAKSEPSGPPKKVRPIYDLGAEEELDLSMIESTALTGQPRAPPPPPGAAKSQAAAPPPGPPPGARSKRPPKQEVPLDLDPVTERLPDDAILSPPAAADQDDGVSLDDDGRSARRAAAPGGSAKRPAASAAPSRAASKSASGRAPVSEEINFDDVVPSRPPPPSTRPAAPPSGLAQPIADLLGSAAEEEIELLSISSDEAIAERPIKGTRPTPDEADLDAAFGAISPAARPPAKRAPPKKVPLFDDLKQDAFVELVNKLTYRRHVAGQLIIKEGDPGRSFFVIVEGKVRIYKQQPDGQELTLAHLGEGAFFGEMALLSGAPRTANVVAEEETELLEVTDVVLRELAQNHPAVVTSLKNFYRQRLLNNVMAISPLFRDFDPAERKAIVEKFKMRQAAAGEVLITEGKNSDGLYVVLHGSVGVAARKGAQPVALARLKEGEIFGEMSLLTRKPATATVTSQGNSILLKLRRESFQELVLTHPQILELVSELTEKRKSATEAILSGQGPGHDGMSFV